MRRVSNNGQQQDYPPKHFAAGKRHFLQPPSGLRNPCPAAMVFVVERPSTRHFSFSLSLRLSCTPFHPLLPSPKAPLLKFPLMRARLQTVSRKKPDDQPRRSASNSFYSYSICCRDAMPGSSAAKLRRASCSAESGPITTGSSHMFFMYPSCRLASSCHAMWSYVGSAC